MKLNLQRMILMVIIVCVMALPSSQMQAAELIWKFTTIADTNTRIPNGDGTFTGFGGGDFSEPTIDGKTVAFLGSGSNQRGIYMGTGCGLNTVADTNTPIPGFSDLKFFGFSGPPCIDDNIVSFFGGAPFDNVIFEGIFKYVDGNLSVVVDNMTPIPYEPVPESYFKFEFSATNTPIVALDNGDVVFSSQICVGSLGDPGCTDAVFKEVDGNLSLVADSLTIIPGSDGIGSRITAIDDGNVAFLWSFPGVESVTTDAGGFLNIVADTGTEVPALPGETFQGFLTPKIEKNTVMFKGYTGIGGPGDQQGIYKAVNENLSVVVSTDTDILIPGFPDYTAQVSNIYDYSLNNGNVLLLGRLKDSNNNVIVTDVGGAPSLVADQSGQILFETGQWDGREISDLKLSRIDALSYSSFAFAADFTDGSKGVFRADLVGLEFDDFSDTSFLTLNAEAQQEESDLRLTPDEPSKAGSAFFSAPFSIGPLSSFQTHFTFRISGENNGGLLGSDGLAFVIHSDPRGATALGTDGGSLGLGEFTLDPARRKDPISPSVAIEFDTHKNGFDPDGNHVALILDGNVENHIDFATPTLLLNSGDPVFVWIDYNESSNLLEIFLSDGAEKPDSPLFSETLNLFSIVGDKAYMGFTAGNGDGFNIHEVLNWECTILSEEPEPGDLDGDGMLDFASDFTVFLNFFGSTVASAGIQPDYDGDGVIGLADYSIFLSFFR